MDCSSRSPHPPGLTPARLALRGVRSEPFPPPPPPPRMAHPRISVELPNREKQHRFGPDCLIYKAVGIYFCHLLMCIMRARVKYEVRKSSISKSHGQLLTLPRYSLGPVTSTAKLAFLCSQHEKRGQKRLLHKGKSSHLTFLYCSSVCRLYCRPVWELFPWKFQVFFHDEGKL